MLQELCEHWMQRGISALHPLQLQHTQPCALQPSNHRASPSPWQGGSGLLHLPEQPGVEIPVGEKKMSDNTPGTALPKAAEVLLEKNESFGRRRRFLMRKFVVDE